MPIKPRKLESLLKRIGATVATKKSGSGHKTIIYRGRKADLPIHGGGFEISDFIVKKILRDLGLTKEDIGL